MSVGPSNKYPFGVYTGVKTATSVPTKDSPDLSPVEIEKEVKALLGNEGYQALHRLHKKDQHDAKNGSPPSPTAHRDYFAKKLDEHMLRIPPAATRDKTITLREFFSPSRFLVKGKEDELKNYQDFMISLYKNALKEESNSPEFRNAVFLQSCQPKMGVKFDAKYAEHIAGPSGGGKSKARDKVTETIMKEEKEKLEKRTGLPANEDHLHHFVSVDGGIDRDVSQVRSLLFSAVLEKGYKGPEDLQKHSKKTAMKNKVKNAVIASPGHFHLVIPDTYTDPFKRYGQAIFSKLKSSGYKQIFVTVTPDQEQTFISGNNRAWMKKSDERKIVRDPNLKDKPEGKKYDPELFDAGVGSSKLALRVFNKFVGGRTFEIDNDVMYFRKDDNSPSGYSRCTKENYEVDLISNKRTFSSFENFNNNILIIQLQKIKALPGMEIYEKAYIDKMINEVNRAPQIKDKIDIINANISAKGAPSKVIEQLQKFILPVENYRDWVKEVEVMKKTGDVVAPGQIAPAGLTIKMPQYYLKLWEADGKQVPLDKWKDALDKRFGIVVKETTDPSLKEKIEKKQTAASTPLPAAKQSATVPTLPLQAGDTLPKTEEPTTRERRVGFQTVREPLYESSSFSRQPDNSTSEGKSERKPVSLFWKKANPAERMSFRDSVLGPQNEAPTPSANRAPTLPKNK